MTWIAEFPVTWVINGKRVPGRLAIGMPELVPDQDDDETICPVALDGLQPVTPVRGGGTFHALLQGLHFMELRLRDHVAAGVRVLIPGYNEEPESDTASLLRMFKPFVQSWPPEPEPDPDPESPPE